MRFNFPRISEAKDYVITAFLLIFSSVLLVSSNQGGINNIRRASITVFSYLQEPLSNIRMYRQALKTNSELRKQNILLLDELNRLRSARQENEQLRSLLQFSRKSDFSLYPVQIVGKKLNQISNNNVFTIDAGTDQGIETGMPLISGDGLIGKVILAADKYSQVMPYFNNLFRVSAKLGQSNAYGMISWNGESVNYLELQYIPQTVKVDTGDVVLTSGYSHHFPANIPIGKVIDYQPNKGKDTQHILIQPYVNLYSVSAGFVVTSKPDSSLKNLDKKYQNLFK